MSETAGFQAPYPGSRRMPRWTTGELIDAPRFQFNLRTVLAMIGPGLVMGAAAIGGGEWTLGPKVTAQYGGAVLWLTTLSIVFQVIYNREICRYTLYCGEPIFTGKFRVPPGPLFWVCLYVLVDWGAFFPYLITNAAVPVVTLILGELPPAAPETYSQIWWLQKTITIVLFMLIFVPLVFGGKVYNSLKVVMSFKLVYVLGLLLFLGIFYAHGESWWNIVSGFGRFGSLPVQATVDDTTAPATNAAAAAAPPSTRVENVFGYRRREGQWPLIDFSLVAYLCALAAIAGNGGLTNAPISNFVRDHGWGMGHHVGAIPSVVGGHGIELSHEGCVFEVTAASLPRWRRWLWHVTREQMFIWLPACFVGIALPSILSVEFLPRGSSGGDWNLAAMTAEGVEQAIAHPANDVLASQLGFAQFLANPAAGRLFFVLVLLCGFVVLITSGVSTADGFTRRWVDLIWVAVPRLRRLNPGAVKYVYFTVLMCYGVIGLTMLLLPQAPGMVTKLATTGYNFALGFSSWHTLAANLILLPRELRPNWTTRVLLILGGVFFVFLGTMSALSMAGAFDAPK